MGNWPSQGVILLSTKNPNFTHANNRPSWDGDRSGEVRPWLVRSRWCQATRCPLCYRKNSARRGLFKGSTVTTHFKGSIHRLSLPHLNSLTCLMTSGAIQKGVPTKVFRRDVVAVIWAATPKSANFTSPVWVQKARNVEIFKQNKRRGGNAKNTGKKKGKRRKWREMKEKEEE